MDRVVVIEFTDGRSLINQTLHYTGRPDAEVTAELNNIEEVYRRDGFRPTGTLSFLERQGDGTYRRLSAAEIHDAGPRVMAGFRTSSAFVRA